jgi:hypothetical protein
MTTNRKKRSDTVAGAVQAKQDESRTVQVPLGVKMESTEEKILWDQFTAARAIDSWRAFDLISLAKMVKLEVRIRELWDDIDRYGYTGTNPRGTEVVNPLVSVVDTLQRQQMAIIGKLSLGISADKAGGMNANGKPATGGKPAAVERSNVAGLLAN